MKTLEERRACSCLQWPIFLLQIKLDSGWKIDRVFLCPTEAEAYVAARPHHFSDMEHRIYAVPMAGTLTELVEQHDQGAIPATLESIDDWLSADTPIDDEVQVLGYDASEDRHCLAYRSNGRWLEDLGCGGDLSTSEFSSSEMGGDPEISITHYRHLDRPAAPSTSA